MFVFSLIDEMLIYIDILYKRCLLFPRAANCTVANQVLNGRVVYPLATIDNAI